MTQLTISLFFQKPFTIDCLFTLPWPPWQTEITASWKTRPWQYPEKNFLDRPMDALPETLGTHRVTDCRNQWILPGFVDCHTHLIWAGSRAKEFEMRLAGASYADIAKAGGGHCFDGQSHPGCCRRYPV
jgi:hypothetical protein